MNDQSRDERDRTDKLPDGSPSGHDGDADPTSGGAPEDSERTDEDGTPVENPSG